MGVYTGSRRIKVRSIHVWAWKTGPNHRELWITLKRSLSGQGRLEAENQLPACSKNSGCVMVTDHTSIFIEEAIPGVMIFIFDRPMVADFRQELWRAQMGGIKAAYVVRAFRGRFSFVWIMEGALHTGELAGMGQAGRGSA